MTGPGGHGVEQPARNVDEGTEPGVPLGDTPEESTDEHEKLGDSEADTDEHAVPAESPPAEPGALE